MSGKTQFCSSLMNNQGIMYTNPPGKIYFCYNIWSASFDELSAVHKFKSGLPDREWLTAIADESPNCTVYIDDLASKLSNEHVDIFNVLVHHLGINVVFVQHTIFNSQNNLFRLIAQATTYSVIFPNHRDIQSFINMSRQAEPVLYKSLVEAYKDATSKPFGYLFLDWGQTTSPFLRYRAQIFNTENEPTIIYVLNNSE